MAPVVPSALSRSPLLRWTLRGAAAIFVISVAAFSIQGADTTTRARLDTNGARPSRVGGSNQMAFDQIAFQVRAANGLTSHHCGLLALTTAQQDQGLMNRTDLGGYDGMLFEFLDPTTTQFYMKDTLIPLSIAWFDQSGRFISTADMAPCGAALSCPLYAAAAPYTLALEVPSGQLGSVGVGPGSIVTVGGSC